MWKKKKATRLLSMQFVLTCFVASISIWGPATLVSMESPCERILDYTCRTLPMCGILQQDRSGFVYVEVDYDYLCKLTGLIEYPGYRIPDCCRGEGARIYVMSAAEAARYSIPPLEEIGMVVHFNICTCKIVRAEHDPEIDSYYWLILESSELQNIRMKYELPEIPYPFHITIGVKWFDFEYRDAPQALDESLY